MISTSESSSAVPSSGVQMATLVPTKRVSENNNIPSKSKKVKIIEPQFNLEDAIFRLKNLVRRVRLFEKRSENEKKSIFSFYLKKANIFLKKRNRIVSFLAHNFMNSLNPEQREQGASIFFDLRNPFLPTMSFVEQEAILLGEFQKGCLSGTPLEKQYKQARADIRYDFAVLNFLKDEEFIRSRLKQIEYTTTLQAKHIWFEIFQLLQTNRDRFDGLRKEYLLLDCPQLSEDCENRMQEICESLGDLYAEYAFETNSSDQDIFYQKSVDTYKAGHSDESKFKILLALYNLALELKEQGRNEEFDKQIKIIYKLIKKQTPYNLKYFIIHDKIDQIFFHFAVLAELFSRHQDEEIRIEAIFGIEDSVQFFFDEKKSNQEILFWLKHFADVFEWKDSEKYFGNSSWVKLPAANRDLFKQVFLENMEQKATHFSSPIEVQLFNRCRLSVQTNQDEIVCSGTRGELLNFALKIILSTQIPSLIVIPRSSDFQLYSQYLKQFDQTLNITLCDGLHYNRFGCQILFTTFRCLRGDLQKVNPKIRFWEYGMVWLLEEKPLNGNEKDFIKKLQDSSIIFNLQTYPKQKILI